MKKLHQVLFFLLLILLPVQLGRHFWPDFSLVFGIRVDYLSPTVYLTDLLVMGILGCWIWEKIGNKHSLLLRNWKLEISTACCFAIGNYAKRYWWIVAVFFFLLANALFAQNQGVALYELVKIVEFSLLGLYVAKNNYTLHAIAKRQALLIRDTLGIAVIYSSLIAVAQFINQGSLNGVFWFLGERTFNAFTPGIARAVWDGQLIMRPTATFPHPNVLAGFTLVSLILIVTNKTKNAKSKIIKWLAVVLGIVGIFLSFSRAVWLVGLFSLFPISYRLLPKKKRLLIMPLLLVCLVGFFFFTSHLSADEAISRRLQLNQAAVEMIQENPLVGVGLNNFIPRLPDYWQTSEAVRFLQPVHNLFLLVAAETGLIGLLIFLWFLVLTFKKLLEIGNKQSLLRRNWKLVIPLLAILLTGVVDHYWLTLQQTQLLFTLILGLSWAKH